jgi:hypothetical protein
MLRTQNAPILLKIARSRLKLLFISYLTCPLHPTCFFWLIIGYYSPIKRSDPLPCFEIVEVKIQRAKTVTFATLVLFCIIVAIQ